MNKPPGAANGALDTGQHGGATHLIDGGRIGFIDALDTTEGANAGIHGMGSAIDAP